MGSCRAKGSKSSSQLSHGPAHEDVDGGDSHEDDDGGGKAHEDGGRQICYLREAIL